MSEVSSLTSVLINCALSCVSGRISEALLQCFQAGLSGFFWRFVHCATSVYLCLFLSSAAPPPSCSLYITLPAPRPGGGVPCPPGWTRALGPLTERSRSKPQRCRAGGPPVALRLAGRSLSPGWSETGFLLSRPKALLYYDAGVLIL